MVMTATTTSEPRHRVAGKITGIIGVICVVMLYPPTPWPFNYGTMAFVMALVTLGSISGEKFWTTLATVLSGIVFVLANPGTMTTLFAVPNQQVFIYLLIGAHVAPFAVMYARTVRIGALRKPDIVTVSLYLFAGIVLLCTVLAVNAVRSRSPISSTPVTRTAAKQLHTAAALPRQKALPKGDLLPVARAATRTRPSSEVIQIDSNPCVASKPCNGSIDTETFQASLSEIMYVEITYWWEDEDANNVFHSQCVGYFREKVGIDIPVRETLACCDADNEDISVVRGTYRNPGGFDGLTARASCLKKSDH